MDVVWTLPRRIAFRFGIVAGILFIYPFPIGLLPKTEFLAEYFNRPLVELVLATGRLFDLDITLHESGSGDKLYDWVWTALIVVLSSIGAAIWSVVDRKRLAYPRLAAGAVVVLRYVLAMAMLQYGFAKLIPSQFPVPNAVALDTRLGEMSPMSLLWKFMGYSTPYEVFAGAAEVLGAVLLLFRRTATAGALVIIAVMINVVMLNFCYDVPVKLYSTILLLFAVILFAPHARRVIAAVLGRAVPEVPPRLRMSEKRERLRVGLKIVTIASMAFAVYENASGAWDYRYGGSTALEGIWDVDTWSDGTEHPPLLTDPVRWRKVAFAQRGLAIRLMPELAQRTILPCTIDETAHTIAVTDGEHKEVWRYTRTDDKLVLDGAFRGAQIHATLTREPDGVLMTRGFHWIQEQPFNR